MRTILNLAGGKIRPLMAEEGDLIINVDTCYFTEDPIEHVEKTHRFTNKTGALPVGSKGEYFVNDDMFDFLSRYNVTFDVISLYRILEHIHRDQVLYFIYLLSTCVKKDGLLDIIVPDYKMLAQMLIAEDVYDIEFWTDNILLTTEMLNEPDDPHKSIWTADRLKMFLAMEQRFKVMTIAEKFDFDGRDIYLNCIAQRI